MEQTPEIEVQDRVNVPDQVRSMAILSRDLLLEKRLILRSFAKWTAVQGPNNKLILHSKIVNNRHKEVGEVRLTFKSYPDMGEVRIVIEWTKKMLGFWYRTIIYVPFGDYIAALEGFAPVLAHMRWLVNRNVSIGSLNRTMRKVKKNKSRDKAMLQGMRLM